MGPYRVQFEVVDGGVCAAQVDVEVSAEGMGDAAVKAAEIARRDYGDTVKPTGIITYFRPRGPGRAERQVLPRWNLESHMNHKRYVIDVSKTWHVEWWAAKLGVSVEAVLDAVQQVGAEADAVEEVLLARQSLSGRQPFALTPSSHPPSPGPDTARS